MEENKLYYTILYVALIQYTPPLLVEYALLKLILVEYIPICIDNRPLNRPLTKQKHLNRNENIYSPST